MRKCTKERRVGSDPMIADDKGGATLIALFARRWRLLWFKSNKRISSNEKVNPTVTDVISGE